MLFAWRLVRERHAPSAFDGEGARRFGGRWNSPGTRVVYASSSKALAALETLVHLWPPVTAKYVIIPVRFEADLVETLAGKELVEGWNLEPPTGASQHVGDGWVRAGRSAVLAVPSVLTGETNYLLNPAHPDFSGIMPGRPEAFSFDPRLLG